MRKRLETMSQSILGHKRIETTLIYAQVNKDSVKSNHQNSLLKTVGDMAARAELNVSANYMHDSYAQKQQTLNNLTRAQDSSQDSFTVFLFDAFAITRFPNFVTFPKILLIKDVNFENSLETI